MKRFIISLALVLCVFAVAAVGALSTVAEDDVSGTDTSIPDDVFVSYGYLKVFKEQLKQEILAELGNADVSGNANSQNYQDISATEGQIILLAPNSEVIYRGGGAAAVTSSNKEGEGITDMSFAKEIFSGEQLEYGHIYHASDSESKKAIVITGTKAYFTVRGEYEIG